MMRLAALTLVACLSALTARAAVDIVEVTSPGGIRAWLVEEHDLPFTALEIRFRGGAALDAPGKRGAVNMMTGLLEEGAGAMNAMQFAEKREDLAARYYFEAGNDLVRISARFLTEDRDEAVELLRLALTEPRFDDDAIERVRGQALSVIRSNNRDPARIAGLTFNAAAFGDHPYGSSHYGTAESVSALTREDLVDARARALALDRIYVGAAGEITPEELGLLLDRLLGGLPEEGASMPERVRFGHDGGLQVVPFDTPQSVAVFGHEGVGRNDPDFFPAFVMNRILGGNGLSSRLTMEVRVKRGLTYGISSFLLPMELSNLHMGQVASSNDTIAEAIELIRLLWRDMAEGGVSEEELRNAKTYLTGAYPLRFDGNGRIAAILAAMQSQGLGVDYIATRNDKVNAVTQEDIARVARRLLDPEGLLFVVVGQPEGL